MNPSPRSTSRRVALVGLVAASLLASAGPASAAEELVQPPGARSADDIASKRTAFSRTWVSKKGGEITRISPAPLNWKDRTGRWRTFDLGLRQSPDGSREQADVGAGGVSLPRTGDASRAIVVDDGQGAEVRLELEGARAVPSRRAGKQVREFRGVRPGVSQRVSVTPSGMKEDLVLAAPSSPRRFSYRLRLSPGLVPVAKSDGTVGIHRGTSAIFSIPRAVLFERDRPDAIVPGAKYQLERIGGNDWRLSIDADGAWINDPERNWPVVVDPTIVIDSLASVDACRLDYAAAGLGFCFTGPTAVVGWDARGGTGRLGRVELKKFPLPPPLSGRTVTQAVLRLVAVASGNTTGTPQAMAVSGTSVTNAVGTTPARVNFVSRTPVPSVPAAVTIDVTKEIRYWRQAAAPNPSDRGFYLSMVGTPKVVLGPPAVPGSNGVAVCDGWRNNGSATDRTCDQNWISIESPSNPDPAKRPVIEIETAAPAQAGSEIESPAEGKLTSRFVELRAASSSENVTSASFEYVAGASREWKRIPLAALRYKTTGASPASNAIDVGDQRSTRLIWDLQKTPGGDVDGPVHVRALLDAGEANGGGVTPGRNFRVDRKNPDTSTQEGVGPGLVDLLTGDLAITETDVGVKAFANDLQLKRTYHSRGGSPRTTDMFGPGWTSGFDVDGGEMPYRGIYNFLDIQEDKELVDWSTNADDLDPEAFDSSELVIEPIWEYTRFETEYAVLELADGSKLTFRKNNSVWVLDDRHTDLKVTQTSTGFTVTDADGGVTTFAPDKDGSPNYRPVNYTQAGTSKATTFQYVVEAGRKRLTRVVAPSLDGVVCGDGALPAGCRALGLNWIDVAIGGGKTAKRVGSVQLLAADPSGQDTATSRTIMEYEYDATGRLKKVKDPRVAGGLPTQYEYDTEGRLSTYTPPGDRPWTFAYAPIDGDAGNGRVRGITRKTPAGVDATTTFVYDVPLSGAGAPHDLLPAAVAAWGQVDRPQTATAVFPPDAVPSGSGMPTSWARATISYLGVHGKAVNVADPAGKIRTNEYDLQGNVVRELGARNRERALAATETVDRSRALDTQYEYAANGVDLISEIGPEHRIREQSGGSTLARQYKRISYDVGKPAAFSGDLHMVTQARSGAYRTADKHVIDEQVTTYAYSAGTSNRGWEVRKPLSVTVGYGTPDAATTTYSYHNTYPLLVQKRMPKAGTGTVSQATNYTYFGVTSTLPGSSWCTSGAAGLSNAAAAGGLLCAKVLDAQPSSGAAVPGTFYRYGLLWEPTEERRASSPSNVAGTTVRTVSVQRDLLGRETSKSVSATTGRAIPTVVTAYNGSTGRVATSTTAALGSEPARSLQRSYDDNGRLASYTDADGGTTTYTYDLAGRPDSVQDPRGTRGVVYDSRDLVSSVLDSTLPGLITNERDADGNVTKQTLPGGIVQTTSYNENGDSVALDWDKGASCSADCSLVQDAVTRDSQGRLVAQQSAKAEQTYAYDGAGRLAATEEQRGGKCTTRAYGYDKNSNRTSLATRVSSAGDPCGTGSTTTDTNTIDGVDRLANPGYSYDGLGRTTTVPAADSPDGNQITLTYDVDDLAASIEAGSAQQTLTRDPIRRLRTDTSNGTGLGLTTSVLRYGTDDDAPTAKTGTWGWQRYVADTAGAQIATATDGGVVTWQLTDLQGNVVSTTRATGTTPPAENGYDEFGRGTWSFGATGLQGLQHGWLGGSGKLTAFTPGGLVHMGGRVYNPKSGRFLQVDPVDGGSANAYDYCFQDPVNGQDLDGRKATKKKKQKSWDAVVTWNKVGLQFGPSGSKALVSDVVGYGMGLGVTGICAAITEGLAVYPCGLAANILINRVSSAIADRVIHGGKCLEFGMQQRLFPPAPFPYVKTISCSSV